MKFTYNGGDYRQDRTVFVGRRWEIGQPIDVPDHHSIAQLKAHPHFDEGEGFVAGSPILRAQLEQSIEALENAFAEAPGAADATADHGTPTETAHEADGDLANVSYEELERLTDPDAPSVKSRGGRPKGSKNKPKDEV